MATDVLVYGLTWIFVVQNLAHIVGEQPTLTDTAKGRHPLRARVTPLSRTASATSPLFPLDLNRVLIEGLAAARMRIELHGAQRLDGRALHHERGFVEGRERVTREK